MTLRLVACRVVICAPWHLWGIGGACAYDDQHPIGARCHGCGRDVALPRSKAGEAAICLYCGMERGLVEMVEVEP